MIRFFRQLFGLCAHDMEMKIDDRHKEIYMRCVDCGHRTNGWQLGDIPPVSKGLSTKLA